MIENHYNKMAKEYITPPKKETKSESPTKNMTVHVENQEKTEKPTPVQVENLDSDRKTNEWI